MGNIIIEAGDLVIPTEFSLDELKTLYKHHDLQGKTLCAKLARFEGGHEGEVYVFRDNEKQQYTIIHKEKYETDGYSYQFRMVGVHLRNKWI